MERNSFLNRWNFVGWYIEALGRFSDRSQLPMRANSTSWEAYKDLSFFATYWMERNSFFARCEIQTRSVATNIEALWRFSGRSVSTSYASQINFQGIIKGVQLGKKYNLGILPRRTWSNHCQLNFLCIPTQLPRKHKRSAATGMTTLLNTRKLLITSAGMGVYACTYARA